MKQPILYRKSIPFFYNKSEKEFRKHTFEQYDPMVIRQSALHMIDALWGGYPMQPIVDFTNMHWPDQDVKDVVEIGRSVVRWIGGIAEKFPSANCWEIDYSYQLLKRA